MADIEKIRRKRRRNAMIAEVTGMKPKMGNNRNDEHKLQVRFIKWLEKEWPQLWLVTFAVPNGGVRDELTAVALNEEGVRAGVADIIILKSNDKYGSLCIEMKTPKGKQSPVQKRWEEDCKLIGGADYKVVKTMEDGQAAVEEYAKDILWDHTKEWYSERIKAWKTIYRKRRARKKRTSSE